MKIVIGAVIIIVLVGGFLMFRSGSAALTFNNSAAVSVSPSPGTKASPSNTAASSGAVSTSTSTSTSKLPDKNITVAGGAADPASLTIPVGTKVTLTNITVAKIDIESDPHPAHTDYQELNSVNTIAPNEKKSFTFDKPGTFGWHNHLRPHVKGTVIVK